MSVLRCALALMVLWGAAGAQAQTGRLNDTGDNRCYDGAGSVVSCDAAIAGGTAAAHEDGRYGRDAAADLGVLNKVGAGAVGFDFTRLCWSGDAEGSGLCTGSLVANRSGAASVSPSTDWACSRDNHTGLVWSLQSQTTDWAGGMAASFPDAGHNSAARCGFSSGWRVPTVIEMLGLVHNGLVNGRKIDADYFPLTDGNGYWTSAAYAPDLEQAWFIDFNSGNVSYAPKGFGFLNVRLVHDLP